MRWFYVVQSIVLISASLSAGDDNQLAYLDECSPWYPDQNFPKLTTPQWVGEDGVQAVVVLAIDDMRDTAKYEQYLRPILSRLKQIDGRAPVSIMTCDVKPDDPQLQSWLEEGLSIEVHTIDHPCPLLQAGDLEKAKSTYDRCIDLLATIPGNKPVAFRTPCCDSLNTVSPRFYSTIFNKTTPDGKFLQIDSSVMNFFTSEDTSIPRELVLDKDGKERFWKYKVRGLKRGDTLHDNFVNYIRNYPYPYVINNTCWQFPCVAPSDWSAQHLHGTDNPVTVEDWKAALDITVHKQGVFNLVFHPHGWIKAEQVVELIDHAVEKHGSKVKFLSFREAAERLNKSLCDGKELRHAGDLQKVSVSHAAFRTENPGPNALSAIPKAVREAVELRRHAGLLPLQRPDGSHNGVFVHDSALCWQNEDTAHLPNLIQRVSFDELLAERRRREARLALPPVPIGAAVVDITPDYPVRLTGYGNRATESAGVAEKLHARALAIGGNTEQPLAILMTVDNCGVPTSVTEAVFAKATAKHRIGREHFALCSTHTHSGPWLRDFAPNVLSDLTDAETAHLKQYQEDLITKLVEVVDKAIASRQPGRLSTGRGTVGFAINRRTLTDGRWTGFGETPDGPVDHQLPILAAHDVNGKLIAVLANYACHATTETGQFNQISGDWPGLAADLIEADNTGAVALIAIGCGADANPAPRGTHEMSRQHGQAVADEVNRLLGHTVAEGVKRQIQLIDPRITCNMAYVDLPLGPLPSREEWEQRAKEPGHTGVHARQFLKLLDDGKSVPTTVPRYPVQTWCFGEDLAMVFLGGEVVVDYSIRLNEMLDGDRLWTNAYSNDVPCYIASKRILREGGYEADQSMVYYGRPTRLAPEAEDIICDTVQKLLPHTFYSAELRVEFPGPKTPEESLACITTRANVRVELVAAEPLIQDPVAFDWDVQGRLWVVEMGDYPNGSPGPPLDVDTTNKVGGGRVRVLEDTDSDGRYDKATTFLDGLPFPTGMALWRNGVIITAAPDVIYAQDTDGDFIADVRQVLYTGFQEGNQQHRVNGLRWGLDGLLYLANGDSGGEISVVGALHDGAPTDVVSAARTNISGRDLRINPDLGLVDAVSGRTQFGRERDDFGNWFGNNNSNPIWHYVLEDHYLRRNPYATASTTRAEVSEIPGAAPVFPTSKTMARFNDFDKVNRFTSACSTSIYRDSFLGEEFYGNAFTCEPVHNLVSRLVLERDGVAFKGRRAEDERESEFFASSDNWTRPVMVRTGPDGAIYVADMYRQVIEHPTWIPAEYQRKLNLQAGSHRGRIFRVVPAGECCQSAADAQLAVKTSVTAPSHLEGDKSAASSAEPRPNLRDWFTKSWQETATDDLIERVASPNGWWRDTAQRILQHRGTVPFERLAELGRSHSSAAVRVQSLYTTQNVNSADKAKVHNQLLFALNDEHPEVRRNALKLLESALLNRESRPPDQVLQLVDDPSAVVRRQLALSLGASGHRDSAQALATLLRQNTGSIQIVDAVMTALTSDNIGHVLQQTISDGGVPDTAVAQLISQAAAMKKVDALRQPVRAILQQLDGSAQQKRGVWDSATQVIRSIRRHDVVDSAVRNDVSTVAAIAQAKASAAGLATNPDAPDDLRVAALQFTAVAGIPNSEAAEQLVAVLSPLSSIAVQQAAATAVIQTSPDVAATLFDRWSVLTPAVRSSIVEQLLQSSSRTELLVDAVAAKKLAASDIDASVRERLFNHRNDKLRLRAKEILGTTASIARAVVIADIQMQIDNLTGDATVGKAVFEKRCATCHRLQNTGKAIGADLAALKDRSTNALLIAMLDPNNAVETKFLSYTAVTANGLTFNGMLLSETGNSVTLMGTDGKEHILARTDLDELNCSNRSLMPEGLEKDLTPQDFVDVIAFVQSSGVKWKQFEGNQPQVITADADGTLTLSAAAAEIYGPSLIFERKYSNLGFWSSTRDYAVWNIDSPASGHWTVEIEYACDNATAGNPLKLSTGSRLLSARVPGTGNWDTYRTWTAGNIDLRRGRGQLIVTAPDKPTFALIDLRAIRLIPPK
ncbi:MAG: c-type cytochrome [Fuerstiella sp.]|nr:c-type cytochrome [Fuerstiella sp.]MCP4858402.1 c-type cytochrome [Fuerstiella sp.]